MTCETNRARQFAGNSLWLVVSLGCTMLVGAIYRPLIGRALGPDVFGRYSFIQTYIAYFLVIAFFGLKSVITRAVGQDSSSTRAYLLSAAKLRVVTTSVAVTLSLICAPTFHKGTETNYGIAVTSLAILSLAASDLFEGVLVGLHRSFYLAVSTLIGNVLKLLLGIWCVRAGFGLIGVLWTYVASATVTAALSYWFASRVVNTVPQSSKSAVGVRHLLGECVPFFALFVAGKVYARNDILIVSMLCGDKTTGVYSAAYVFVDVLMNIAVGITSAAYPVIARLYGVMSDDVGERKSALSDIYERLHRHLLMLLVPVCALLSVAGKDLLLGIFGAKYLAGGHLMAVLVWTPVFEASCLVSGNLLSAMYLQKLEARIGVVLMAVSVGATIVLVRLFGAAGAAIATLGGSVLNSLVRYYYVSRVTGGVSAMRTWLKPAICGSGMLLAMMTASACTLYVRVPFGLLGFALCALAVRPYDAKDVRLVRAVLRR